MRKILIAIILAIGAGFAMGYIVFLQYENPKALKKTFQEQTKIYVVQQGVYSSIESMEKNTMHLTSFVYEEKEGKFYVYIAMTIDQNNVIKLQEYFKEKGYVIYVKEFMIGNRKFIEKLEEYDMLLKKTEEKGSIEVICSQVLNQYKELVLDEHKNQGYSFKRTTKRTFNTIWCI